MIRKPQEKLSQKMFECAGSSFKAKPKQKQKQNKKQKRKDQTPKGEIIIHSTISFLIGRKRTVNFRSQRLRRHQAADYTIIMSRTLKVHG